ncbi:hypothetical protein BU16DRAFT_559465 [Lophium mytilinum]|uniref:Uncharacterized protein n=1 Tax=Lophium mytilinum TaxID=390894 RepID=A0A6A6QZ27_9PEZI|nr:hypothetical protein BU16DRAFT_559465 [Lophium mytilinum]
MLSNSFKVLEGLEKIEFTTDSALLASKSPELDRLINRYLVQNKEPCTNWQHIDAGNFIHFGELTTRWAALSSQNSDFQNSRRDGAYYEPKAKRRTDTVPSSSKSAATFHFD